MVWWTCANLRLLGFISILFRLLLLFLLRFDILRFWLWRGRRLHLTRVEAPRQWWYDHQCWYNVVLDISRNDSAQGTSASEGSSGSSGGFWGSSSSFCSSFLCFSLCFFPFFSFLRKPAAQSSSMQASCETEVLQMRQWLLFLLPIVPWQNAQTTSQICKLHRQCPSKTTLDHWTIGLSGPFSSWTCSACDPALWCAAQGGARRNSKHPNVTQHHKGLSENSVPLNPMVNDHYLY